MSQLRQIIIPPPGTRTPENYVRSLSVRLQEGFDEVRENLNARDDWESMRFMSVAATNGGYTVGLAQANRRISGVYVALRAGTLTLEVLYGKTGSEVAATWQKAAPTNLIAVTTTPQSLLPDTNRQILEAADWVILTVTASAGASDLSVVLLVD